MQLGARFDHFNINVSNLDKSIAFYQQALGLQEIKRHLAEDGSFILVYLGDSKSNFLLELTWLRDKEGAYELGDNESHLCLKVSADYQQVHDFHQQLGCICYENTEMGLYFIHDPDDYWIEILPEAEDR